MTPAELEEIAARAEAWGQLRVDDPYPPPIGSPLHEIARTDVPALVAEVRRLRTSLAALSHAADYLGTLGAHEDTPRPEVADALKALWQTRDAQAEEFEYEEYAAYLASLPELVRAWERETERD